MDGFRRGKRGERGALMAVLSSPDPSSTKSHHPTPPYSPSKNPAETGAAGDGEEGAGARFVAIFYNLARGGREWRGVEGKGRVD